MGGVFLFFGGFSWCRGCGVEEQRLFEMAKLNRQFSDLLRDAGLRAAGSVEGEVPIPNSGSNDLLGAIKSDRKLDGSK